MSENKITFPAKLASNNSQSFGIADATDISGHKSVDTLSDLYAISDPVLSILKDGSDAIGQEWFVVSEDCKYRLDNWENRKSVAGWTKLPKQELINIKQSVSEKDQPGGYAGLDSNGKLPIEKTYGATATVVDVETYEALPVTGLNGVIYYVSNTGAQYKWSGSAYIDITDGADNAKKNETSIFDCSNGTSTKYYSSLSAAINVVPLVYRTSNRIISYLSTENATTTAVNYQYNGIDSTTWTDLTKWKRIPTQADLAEIWSEVPIKLSKFESSPIIEKAGDWVFNKADHNIITKDASGNLIFREKNRNQLYLWQNEIYEWNEDLTDLIKVDTLFKEKLQTTISFPFALIQASQVNNGSVITGTTNRLLTDLFSNTGAITLKKGWSMKSVAYFNVETLEFDSYSILNSASSATIGKDGCLARLEIAKIDNSECTPADYYAGDFINTYINGKIKEIQADVDTMQKAFMQTEQVIPMKFGKLSNGRIDISVYTDLYDDFFNHLHSALYSVDKVSELGSVFQEIDIVRTSNQVIRISKVSDLALSASIGDEVVTTPSYEGGWRSTQIPVKSGETYVVSGVAAGGRLPLVAVVNSLNILVQKVNGATGFTTVTVNIEEDGQMIINQVPGEPSPAYQIQELALQYHYYNDRYSYLGEFGVNIPDNAKYLRLSSTSYIPYESEHSVILPYIGTMTKSKENINPLSVALAYYPVYLHNQNADNEAENTLQDPAELTYDQIKFILPQNYNPNGDPVRLVIYVQGSAGSYWTDRSFNGSGAQSRATYIAQEGYAIMMINGITAKYHALYPELNDNFATPTGMACYMYAYEWMINNFNIKTDGVFVYGKSLGGIGVGNILHSKLPVLAAAGLAPTLDCISEVMRNRDAQAKQFYADQFGMVGDITFTDRPIPEANKLLENEFFKANAHKVIGYNPIWNGTIGLDVEALLTETYKNPIIHTGIEHPVERALYESLPHYLPAPLKIWIAKDDVNVDPRLCDYMQKMCQKGGSLYRLRWMPENTGKHWSVDNGSEVDGVFQEPIKATVKPRHYSVEVTQPVAFIEMISWFRRFES